MNKRKILTCASVAAAALLWGAGLGRAQTIGPVTGTAINYDLPNYANSPLPTVAGIASFYITDGGAGYTVPPIVTITGGGQPDTTTTAGPLGAGGSVTSIVPPGNAASYIGLPTVTITPAFVSPGVLDAPTCGATAVAIMNVSGGGLHKFIDSLPGLGPSGANTLIQAHGAGQYIPVAVSDPNAFPGSDYYEIAVVDYTEKMHRDLANPTRLRGYVQLSTAAVPGNQVPLFYPDGTTPIMVNGLQAKGVDNPHYLGPLIIATKNVPTRIKFYNLLPTGATGDLYLPVDTTLMGAGVAGWAKNSAGVQTYTLGSFPQNRATLHLHGGLTPWVSDGTPHQWTVPVGDASVYQKGVSSASVPDMADGQGVMTFYYPNQQSGRLMFYHDHAYGITRLNVYAGEAAGYLLTDPDERALNATAGIYQDPTTLAYAEIPLVIQDKTFVWTDTNPNPLSAKFGTLNTDPLWSSVVSGSKDGDLWLPHVYMANQNPADIMGGANPLGRWDYGPWFWPPQQIATLQPMPALSTVPESFMDTPVVNGTAYPYVNVPAGKVRLRILNACNDRMLNLQLYQADPANGGAPIGGAGLTEVKMVPAFADPAIPFPPAWLTQTPGMIPEILDNRPGGVPDPRLRGPALVQIGTEGGLLPAPVVLNNTPVGYEQNKRNIVVLNVSQKTLFMGPAERADVIVDFSQYGGKTVILYNDSPAPVPAGDPRLAYYTGNEDFSANSAGNNQGGAPSTLPGYGPNIRTIMQFRVQGTPGAPLGDDVPANLATISSAVTAAFVARNEPPIVPEPSYPLGTPGNSPTAVYSFIQDNSLTFTPVGSATAITMPMQPKAIHELFDDYGRMNSVLGVELPFTSFLIQTTIPLQYIDPTTETIPAGQTQIWKITHNGVDTHAIHFHLVNVQVINRVGWDGAIRPPDLNELGWKETVRMNPLEDVIVAATAKPPILPFSLPNSSRVLDVTAPLNTTAQFTGVNPQNGTPITVRNVVTQFDWEYVWHCHLLGHEENDMMRPLVMTGAAAFGYQKNPTITASLPPFTTPLNGGWYASSVGGAAVTLAATPWSVTVPIKSITYSATGAQPIASTTTPGTSVSTPLITALGITTVSFSTVDTMGLHSTPYPQTVAVQIDGTAPTVTVSASRSGNSVNVKVSGTVTDTQSGVRTGATAATYTITAAGGTGTFTPLNGSVSIANNGTYSTGNLTMPRVTGRTYTITVTAADNVGNSGSGTLTTVAGF